MHVSRFRVGIAHRVYNATLRRALSATGLTDKALRAELGVPQWRLTAWLAFRAYPSEDWQLRLSVRLGVPADDLFPTEIEHVRVRRQPVPRELSLKEFRELSNSWLLRESVTLDEGMESAELLDGISKALATLTPREQYVLRARYGFGDGRSRTLGEVGKEFGVGKERIHQIEAKALRKLRHPSRSRALRDFICNDSPVPPLPDEEVVVDAMRDNEGRH